LKTKFDWRAAYFNLVSLVAVIVFLIAAINAGHGVLRLIFPKLSMNQSDWQQVESFEAYKRWHGERGPAVRELLKGESDSTTVARDVDEEKLREDWNEYRILAIQGERRRGLWDLLQALVTLIVALPVFWWHRRGAKELKSTEETAAET
jgi:hypothetical protein